MKNISKLVLSLIVCVMAFSGCDEDDTVGASTMVPTTPFPGITVTSLPVNVIMEERDTVMVFDLTLAAVQTVDVSIKISVDEASTAIADEDFVLSTTNVVIPAFTLSGRFTVEIFRDGAPEGDDETVIINVGDRTTANAVFEPQQMSLTLTNYSLPTMDIVIDWSGDFQFVGSTFPFCGNVDVDPLALAANAGTFSLSNDWGACPEEFTNVGDGLPTSSQIGGSNIVWNVDSYLFLSDLYSNVLWNYAELAGESFPITSTIARLGVTLPYAYAQRDDQVIQGDDAGYYEDGIGTTTMLFVLDIEAGNVYKFYDPVTDDLFLTTRMANILDDARKAKAELTLGTDELVQ